MPANPIDRTAHCAVRLRAAASHLSRQLRAALPAEAIGVARLSVLGQLHRHGPLTPTELAQHERVKLQSLTRLLAELEADGWIARRPHGTDGRQTLLSLTTAGIGRLTADVHRREASLVTAIGAKLTDDEQALLLRACELIDRVAAGLSTLPGWADAAGHASAPTSAPTSAPAPARTAARAVSR